MFSKEIVGSDAFQDMPSSSQLLYFHLGMEADDDGFIGNPKKISRSIGMADDDMKILVAKRFVLLFDSGVLVIKHHRINNNWDKYNCKRTMYVEEFNQLYIKPNKAYTQDKTQGIPIQSENSLKTVFRIEENRIEENRRDNNASVVFPKTHTNFLDQRRAERGLPPMEKKQSASQKRVFNELLILDGDIQFYKALAKDKGFTYLELPEDANAQIRRQMLSARSRFGDQVQDFYQWLFDGNNEWPRKVGYNPEACITNIMFAAYKNRGVTQSDKPLSL